MLLGVRRNDIPDKSGKLCGLLTLLFFSQAHFRHLIFKDSDYFPRRPFSGGFCRRLAGANCPNCWPRCARHKEFSESLHTNASSPIMFNRARSSADRAPRFRQVPILCRGEPSRGGRRFDSFRAPSLKYASHMHFIPTLSPFLPLVNNVSLQRVFWVAFS